MKKIIFTVLISLGFITIVNAKTNDTTLTFNNLKDYNYEIKGEGKYLSNYTTMFYANGKLAYCIEPGVDIETHTYNSDFDWSKTKFTKEQTDYLELIGYFGYEYPGHNQTKYYLAAQELIWEYIGKVSVRFTTEKGGKGTEINLNNEKNTILKLIEDYKKNPKFNNDTFSINLENTIKDENSVLNNYEITNSNVESKIKDNSLIFKSKEEKEAVITLKYKKYDTNTTLVYTQGSSQKLATLRLSQNKETKIKLNFVSGKIDIQKYGEKLKEGYAYQMEALKGVKFGLFNLENNLIKEITTDNNGKALINNLNFGKYYLMELENMTNHKLDPKKYFFEINLNNLDENIIINNYLPKGKIKIIKKDAENKLLSGAKFGIYDEKDNLICIKTTDNGIILIEDLAFGKYYLKEIQAPIGYELNNEKYYFEINDENKLLELEVKNDLIIEVPKTDKNSNILILFTFLTLILIEICSLKKY